MKMSEKTWYKLTAAVFICVFVCMLVFNFLTPRISDDFAHYYGCGGDHITSFASLIENLKIFRSEINGRVIAHFFVYLFLIPPKFIFNIINALVSVLVLFCFFRFFRSSSRKKNFVLLVTSVFMIWYFTPGFGQVYLWLTGSCNYSWGLAADLALVYPFFRRYACGGQARENTGAAGRILLPVLAFFCGAYSENGAAAVIFTISVFALFIWIKEKKMPLFYVLVCVSAVAGFAFLMTAPSEMGGRTGDLSTSGIFDSAKNCIVLTQKYCRTLYMIYAAALALAVVKKADRKMIISSLILVAAGAVSIAVFAFAAYLPQRSFFIMVEFTSLASILLVAQIWDQGIHDLTAVFCAAMAVAFLFSFVVGAGDIFSLKMQEKAREAQIAQALSEGETDVELRAYASSTMYPAAFAEELTEAPGGWYNELLAKYYGLHSVAGTGINYYFD